MNSRACEFSNLLRAIQEMPGLKFSRARVGSWPMSWVESQPQYYLERAALARIEAQTTGDAEIRDELLRIAISFEMLAVHKKQQASGR